MNGNEWGFSLLLTSHRNCYWRDVQTKSRELLQLTLNANASTTAAPVKTGCTPLLSQQQMQQQEIYSAGAVALFPALLVRLETQLDADKDIPCRPVWRDKKSGHPCLVCCPEGNESSADRSSSYLHGGGGFIQSLHASQGTQPQQWSWSALLILFYSHMQWIISVEPYRVVRC
jgi:hypothetical protein